MSIRSTWSLLSLPFAFASLLPLAAGCSGEPAQELGSQESADEIAPFDDPSGLLGEVSRNLVDNFRKGDLGEPIGTSDDLVPYPDTYWPMTENGIDVKWSDGPSPLEKFVTMTNPANLAAARTWNRRNQGTDVPGVQGWFGICHGWAGAAVYEKPVVRPVFAKLQDGRVQACTEGEAGCTKFEIGDVNALLAQVYTDADSRFIGGRCDTSPANIKRDEFGRIKREEPGRTERSGNGRGCKGLNPGALLIVLGHRMKRDHKPFVINAQGDHNTDEIWNQPAYRYTVNRFEPLTEAQAANLVATGKREGEQTKYLWNDRAKGFAFVDVTLHWVTENGPNVEYVSGLASTRTTRMVAVIELSKELTSLDELEKEAAAEPGTPKTEILGGEYLDDPSIGATRLRVPPFVWATVGPSSDTPSRYNGHNPYIKTTLVRQLAALGQ